MNRIAAALTALVLTFTLPAAARADDASIRAKAEQMIALQHIERTVQQIAEGIAKQVDDAGERSAGPDATAEQKAKVDDFKKQVSQLIDAKLGWSAMKPAIVDIYVKTYSEDQIDAIIAFYKTPAGTALLDKTPEINTQFGQLGNTRVADLRDQLQKAYQDLQNTLHPIPTLGAPAPPAPASPGTAK